MKKRLLKKIRSRNRVVFLDRLSHDTILFTIQDRKRVITTVKDFVYNVFFAEVEVTECCLAKKSPSGKYRRDHSVYFINTIRSNHKGSIIGPNDELPF